MSAHPAVGASQATAHDVPGESPELPAGVFMVAGDIASVRAEAISPETTGSKAYHLSQMARLGLPVPPAFVIGTQFCEAGGDIDPALWARALARLERAADRRLGDAKRPLLVSVRSGAPTSMPGMMDTLLNIGLCDLTIPGLVRQTGNPRLAWDAYRRLIAGYGEIVAGIDAAVFESETMALANGRDERSLDFAELRELTRRHLQTYEQHGGHPFAQNPKEQLRHAIAAVFSSWWSHQACEYRRLNHIDDRPGTAVTVQAMVFGNAGGRSGAGVGFTRDPSTGEPQLWVDFLFNAQGEDVVSGRRHAHGHEELAAVLPGTWDELNSAARRLEQEFGDLQEFEFTVQDGRLFLLQTRTGKRTPLAAARIALDLMDEGIISAEIARTRTAGLDTGALTQRGVVSADGEPMIPLALAAAASNGVAIGEIALDENRARVRRAAGADVVLLRRDAETRDIAALEQACGLLTERGARTSHAAVVARQLGRVCLVGCEALHIDDVARTITFGAVKLAEGDIITLDGNEGAVYAGAARTEDQRAEELLARLDRLRAPRL